jgi:Asp/Glu/hydantoin racemase
MRILFVNPNTSEGITRRLVAAAAQMASPGVEVLGATATTGPPYISCRSEAIVGAMSVLEILADREGEYDAAVVAAFGDPGLLGARELFDVPIVGMSEAAMLTACTLGKRFAIVTFARAMDEWYAECVAMHGMQERCAGIASLDEAFSDINAVAEEKGDAIASLAGASATRLKADVIILAGAPLAGIASQIQNRVPVPLVDQAMAAQGMAELLVRLRPRKATEGSFRRPALKASAGLSPRLQKRFTG